MSLYRLGALREIIEGIPQFSSCPAVQVQRCASETHSVRPPYEYPECSSYYHFIIYQRIC